MDGLLDCHVAPQQLERIVVIIYDWKRPHCEKAVMYFQVGGVKRYQCKHTMEER